MTESTIKNPKRKALKNLGHQQRHLLLLLLAAVILATLWRPIPMAITESGWHITLIFFATIALVVTNVMPIGMCAILGLATSVVTESLPLTTALSGFASPVTWLVLCAFFLSEGIIKTGLGTRISYLLLSRYGGSLWGTAYSLICTELFLSPLIPSASARSSGIMLPMARSIADQYRKNEGNRNIDKFFVMLLYHTNIITSAMFLTAMAANPLAVAIAANYGVTITWISWAKAAIIPGLLSLLLLPLALSWITKPQLAPNSGSLVDIAKDELRKIGRISQKEVVMIVIFVTLIAAWMTEKLIGVSSTLSALLGVIALLLADIIKWEDITKNKTAWDCLLWYGTLVMLAEAVSRGGAFGVIASCLHDAIRGYPPLLGLMALIVFYTYSHYFFASTTAHMTSLFGICISSAAGLGFDPTTAALLFAFLTSISGGFTHYGMSSAPALFATGHVNVGEWWRFSAVVTNVNVLLWGFVVLLLSCCFG